MKCWKKTIVVILIFCQFFPIVSYIFAASDSFNVNLEVEAAAVICDGDGICETGETESNCSSDCGCDHDGACESSRGENSSNCLSDCFTPASPGEIPDTFAPVIYDVQVSDLTMTSAVIAWKTNEQAKCLFSAGETLDYERVALIESDLIKEHSVALDGLLAATLYNFKITCWDIRNNQGNSDNYTFFTLSAPDTVPPANSSNFQAIPNDQAITLTWNNPLDSDLAGILIVRDDTFYLQRPWEGIVVYDGLGETVVDLNLINGKDYYYTAFSYDINGNYSSGAIVSARPLIPGELPPPVTPPITPPVGPATPEVEGISFNDFQFFQKNQLLSLLSGNKVVANDSDPLTTLIIYEKVPEVLKTIMVTLEKDDKYFSFLLRIDEAKENYQAKFAPLPPGEYPMSIYILNYKNQALRKLQGILEIKGSAMITQPDEGWYQRLFSQLNNELCIFLILLIIIIILLILYYLIKRKQAKKEGKEAQYY